MTFRRNYCLLLFKTLNMIWVVPKYLYSWAYDNSNKVYYLLQFLFDLDMTKLSVRSRFSNFSLSDMIDWLISSEFTTYLRDRYHKLILWLMMRLCKKIRSWFNLNCLKYWHDKDALLLIKIHKFWSFRCNFIAFILYTQVTRNLLKSWISMFFGLWQFKNVFGFLLSVLICSR